MSAASRVLFLGHEATRTGAPVMLLSLLRWLRRHSDTDFDLALQYGGPLIEEYGRLCPVFVVHHGVRWPPIRDAIESVRNPFRVGQFYRPERLMTQLSARHIGLIYSNTIGNGAVLSWLARLNCPVVCHAHDVETSFQLMSDQTRSGIKDSASRFVAVTPRISASLVDCGVAPDQITLVPGFLPVDQFAVRDAKKRTDFRRRHGIPEDAIVVGGCGSIGSRKGTDLFVRVVASLVVEPLTQRVHFVWAGGDGGDEAFQLFAREVGHAGLAGRVTIIPSIAETAAYFNSLDIFAMTSRDDPLPLVVLEAGSCGVPTICFAGNAECVDAESGIVVPPGDTWGFAHAIVELVNDEPRRRRLGQHLAETIRNQHDISRHAPKIVEIIRSFVA